jgi:phage gp45-like
MSAFLEARLAMLERQVAALSRRRGTPFALARSTLAADDTGAVQTVQAQLDALSARDGIPVLYGFGMTGAPPVGTDLHVAFLDNDRSKAVAVAGGHQGYRLRGLGTGDSALYDIRGAYVWLTAGGPSVNCAGQPMTVTGDLHVTGQVYGGFGTSDQVGLLSHRHGTGPAPTAGS